MLSLQNGLTERIIAGIAGPERTIGAFVNFGADWHGPGEVMYGNRGAVVIGEIDGLITGRLESLHRTMLEFDDAAIMTDNIWGYLWGKLAYGAMLFATALNNESMAENFADPDRFPVFDRLGREVMRVAAARGIEPVGFNGFDPAAFAPNAPEQRSRDSIAALAEFNRHTAKTHSGIWRDLAVRKRKTEVDPQIGIIEHKFPEIPGSAMSMLQMVSMESESLVGVMGFNRGLNSESMGKVAAGIRGAMDAVAQREMAVIRRMANGLKKIGARML